MKYFPLLWAGLWRKKTRTVLTLLSVVIAFLLFGLLQGVNAWLGGGVAQIVFALTLTPGLIVVGIVWACVIGLVGALFPAVRAARLPVATALRAV